MPGPRLASEAGADSIDERPRLLPGGILLVAAVTIASLVGARSRTARPGGWPARRPASTPAGAGDAEPIGILFWANAELS